ncbi:MAG: glycosyltransferase family 9 protein, partial [Proteobacteria bacterium]|nr:glycosyltransferase family 9 protein [Pseudomonadota bacterium]
MRVCDTPSTGRDVVGVAQVTLLQTMIIKGGSEINSNVRNILLIQLGDIGDVVWATPTFWAVKELYPNANVSVLLREGFGALLEEDPSLHKIFEVRSYKGSLFNKAIEQIRFIRGLRRERFDLVFDLRAGDRGAITAWLTGAPVRVAIFYDRGVPFWRNRLFTHLVASPAAAKRVFGAAEQSLCIVRELGIDPKNGIPKLWISKDVKKRIREILDTEKITGFPRWITLNPFSRWEYKEWGYDKWVQILNWLWDEYGVATVIVGSGNERERAFELINKCQGQVFNLAGRTTLGELAGVLGFSHLHIGVDSAAPHIAAAVGTPTIT